MAAEIRLAEEENKKQFYSEELAEVSQEREALEAMMEAGKEAYVKVDGNIFRNVVIGVNIEQLTLSRNTGYMTYKVENGVLEGTVIVH